MILIRSKRFILSFIIPLFFISLSVFGQERILSYDSYIDVEKDGSMIVTEVIRVRAEGKEIRRGIYRDFPTYNINGFGLMRIVGFDVLSVKRDNKPEPWHTKKIKNGVRVFIGNENVRLKKGNYTYSIRYKTTHQIGFFDDHDELYWNVTGNGWSFPIDKVWAKVRLPFNVNKDNMTMEGYTGTLGSTEQDVIATVMDDGGMIKAISKLGKKEGLTLVLTWPKGIITPPGAAKNAKYFLIFLYRTWSKVGRDLKPGVIFPHYNPPKGYSPAASRYISEMGYDDGALTAAVINLAVKGYLTIKKEGGSYVLTKASSDQELAPGETVLLEKLFHVSPILELDVSNRLKLNEATASHEESLEQNYLDIYFSRNSGKMWRSALLVFGMFIVTNIVGGVTGSGVIPVFFIPFLLIVVLYIVFKLIMKAPSKKGRLLMDKLEGFKKYLEVAEMDDLNLRNPPEKTPELFEHYLAFAIALGVDQAWSHQFKKEFAGLNTANGNAYHPVWYVGAFSAANLSGFTTDMSSGITSAISSASAAPSSSSGSGGGGFSGGGGGGGGGGGW